MALYVSCTTLYFYLCIHYIDKGAKTIQFLRERTAFSTDVAGASIGKSRYVLLSLEFPPLKSHWPPFRSSNRAGGCEACPYLLI